MGLASETWVPPLERCPSDSRKLPVSQNAELEAVNSEMPASRENNGQVAPTAKIVGGISLVLLLVWLVSFGATVWAYALTHGVYDPSPSITYQLILAAKVSVVTAALSAVTWIWPVIRGRRISVARIALQVGLGTQAILAILAVVGWLSPISPSLFFAEYNWLTFILEVGPVVSATVMLLTICAISVRVRTSAREQNPA